MKKIFAFLFLLFPIAYHLSIAYTDSKKQYQTSIFNNNIASLEINKNQDWSLPAVINLNDDEQIYISFDYLVDELPESTERLIYVVKFCNYDWTENTTLHQNEYLGGVNAEIIENYSFSENTTISYVHYSLYLPNTYTSLKLAGNYVVEIYDENQSKLFLTACFSVLNTQTDITTEITGNTLIDDKKSHQQLDIDIKYNTNIQDIRRDIKVVVRQNERIDNQVIDLLPNYTHPNHIQYKNNDKLIFQAGNEYLRFDSSNKQLGGLNIQNIKYLSPYYHLSLNPNIITNPSTYRYDETQQGKVIYRLRDGGSATNEADYFLVDFRLKSDKKITEDIYVNGNFTFNDFSDKYKMNYDFQNKEYTLTLELKQGIYNYQFLKKDGTGKLSNISGNFYQTKNQYDIYVYHYNRALQYDELIGYKQVTSR